MANRVISFTPRESDKIRANRKENNGLHREYALLDLDTGRPVATLRIYWPGTVAYACVWIHAGDKHARGGGRAGGGGYCKESAAAGAALADAGVNLESDIDGRGMRAIEDALTALGVHLGMARSIVHVAHA